MIKRILILLMISAVPVFSQEKMRIAIMDLEPKDISASDAAKISELIRNEIINTGKYTVIERAQMNNILKEQGLQQAGCTDISCAVEVGKILSARKILVGSVMKLGTSIIITGRIVDIEKGIAEFSEKGTAKDHEGLSEAVGDFVAKLSKRIGIPVAGRETKSADKSSTSGSYGNPYSFPAFGLSAFTLLSLGGGYYYNMQVAKLNSDYDKLSVKYKASSGYVAATALHDKMAANRKDAKKDVLYRNILYGAGGLSFIGSGYFLFRYFTYEPSSSGSINEKIMDMTPVIYAVNDMQKGYGMRSEGVFLGMNISFRF